MKTIARNATRKIAGIKAAVVKVTVYDQSTGNTIASTIDAAFSDLTTFDFARLRDNEDGTWTVYVHSNLWFTLYNQDALDRIAGKQAKREAARAARSTVVTGTREARNARILANTVSIHDLGKSTPAAVAPTDEQARAMVHEVDFTNKSGYSGTIECKWGEDLRAQAFNSADSAAKSGSTIHGVYVLVPGVGRVAVERPVAVDADEQFDWPAIEELADELEATPPNADGWTTLPYGSAQDDLAAGAACLESETAMGRALVEQTVSELTRMERRALRNGVGKPSARKAHPGLRLRSLMTGGAGESSPARLTRMGQAVAAVLRGVPIPA